MSTHKSFDKICCVVLALTLVITVLFVNAEKFGIQKASTVMGYEKTLFDTSRVHTIDIIMDNWDEFTDNAKSEEYYNCTVVIDNEAYKNVAIRGKGNTSLTQVSSYGNNRYSFKIEFDHYDSTKTYYGLDKLCLNNIIQDNTFMKDYLTYQMMAEMGVASPLCSYAYITVNGEDWGLYLAVEGLEEAFLQRNYGKDYGELYKPDSMNMGGGRGNGEKFDMDEFLGNDTETSDTTENTKNTANTLTTEKIEQTAPELPGGKMPTAPDMAGQMPGNMQGGQMHGGQMPGNMQNGSTPPEPPNGETPVDPNTGNMPADMTPPDNGTTTKNPTSDTNTQVQQDSKGPEMGGQMPDDTQGGNKGGKMNGSDDVLLKYIDDEIESYSNIFNNAKTDVSDSDKKRLIATLKKLSNGEELEDTVEIEKVIRYFVVHNFVLNFDSYTGSMIHNYYLYEKDGQMQMVPWDYNLAFGGFQSMGGATNLINYPIDSPVSGGNAEDRPMIAWIFANEEYTELYHQYFAEFISEYFDSGYFTEMMDSVSDMIAPYVEKDPTKFCTYEEFKTGISTLKEFCLLRAESISGQLDGTIGSTSDTQVSNTLIDAGNIMVSDMGSMGMGGEMSKPGSDMQKPQSNSDSGNNDDTTSEKPSTESDSTEKDGNSGNSRPQMPGDFHGGTPPDFSNSDNIAEQNGQPQIPDNSSRPSIGQSKNQSIIPESSLVMIGVSILVLGFGIIFAFKYKTRKY